jgi:hypothetical protein
MEPYSSDEELGAEGFAAGNAASSPSRSSGVTENSAESPGEPSLSHPVFLWLGPPPSPPDDLCDLVFAGEAPGAGPLPPPEGSPSPFWALGPLLSANLACRDPDAPSGLFSLAAAAAAQASAPEAPCGLGAPLFAPRGWSPRLRPLPSFEAFSSSFASLPGGALASAVLRSAGPPLALRGIGLAVAGGAVVAGLCGSAADDFDFFLWGPGLATEACRWRALHCVAACIRRAAFAPQASGPQVHSVLERLSPGVFSARVQGPPGSGSHDVDLQVVLRCYPSLSLALHGFDLPCCSVAFTGSDVLLTPAALFSLSFRAFPVVPSYSSASFARRIQKYFDRGFALLLPGLSPSALAGPSRFDVPSHFSLLPLEAEPALSFFRGSVSLADPSAPASGYSPPSGCSPDAEPFSLRYALASTPPGTPPFLSTSAYFAPFCPRHRFGRRFASALDLPSGLPLAQYSQSPPSLSDLCSETDFHRVVRRAASGYLALDSGRTRPSNLIRTHIMPKDDALALDSAVTSYLASTPRPASSSYYVPGLAELLRPYVEARCAEYPSYPQALPWWVEPADSASQATASFRPTFEDPRLWYGEHFDASWLEASPSPLSDSQRLQLLLFGQPSLRPGSSSDQVCAICQEAVFPDAPNSVTLACGHSFHFAPQSGCSGSLNWFRRGRSCPNCRLPPGPPRPPRRSPPRRFRRHPRAGTLPPFAPPPLAPPRLPSGGLPPSASDSASSSAEADPSAPRT